MKTEFQGNLNVREKSKEKAVWYFDFWNVILVEKSGDAGMKE